MTKNQILNDIIESQLIERCASTFKVYLGNEYYLDYIQEMYLYVISMAEDKLNKLYSANQLNYYILSICRNNIVNPKSKFWRTHKPRFQQVYIEDNPNLFEQDENSRL